MSSCLRRLRKVLRKWRALPASSRELLWGATCRVALARAGLWVLPLPRVRALVGRGRALARAAPEDVAWAVRVCSRYVPRATCLVQAVAVQALLRGSGLPCQLIIGVTLGDDQSLASHAWVECGERVVIGETPGTCYQKLLVIDSE